MIFHGIASFVFWIRQARRRIMFLNAYPTKMYISPLAASKIACTLCWAGQQKYHGILSMIYVCLYSWIYVYEAKWNVWTMAGDFPLNMCGFWYICMLVWTKTLRGQWQNCLYNYTRVDSIGRWIPLIITHSCHNKRKPPCVCGMELVSLNCNRVFLLAESVGRG